MGSAENCHEELLLSLEPVKIEIGLPTIGQVELPQNHETVVAITIPMII